MKQSVSKSDCMSYGTGWVEQAPECEICKEHTKSEYNACKSQTRKKTINQEREEKVMKKKKNKKSKKNTDVEEEEDATSHKSKKGKKDKKDKKSKKSKKSKKDKGEKSDKKKKKAKKADATGYTPWGEGREGSQVEKIDNAIEKYGEDVDKIAGKLKLTAGRIQTRIRKLKANNEW